MDSLPLVIQHAEVCTDAPQVEVAVEERVRLALARSARIRVRFERGARTTEARATLSLGDGAPETRVFSTSSRACASLVRALGAWVSVRLDDWTERNAAEATARETPEKVGAEPTSAFAIMVPSHEDDGSAPTAGVDAPFEVDREGHRIADPTGPELGVTSSLVGGLARTTLVGASVSVGLEVSEGVVFRGGLFGYSAAVTDDVAFGHRMEVCRRFPGGYARFHGLAVDLCGGGELGVLDRQVFAAFGPSMTMHGDLARSLSLDLGGGFMLPFGSTVDHGSPPGIAVAARGDLGLSWRLP